VGRRRSSRPAAGRLRNVPRRPLTFTPTAPLSRFFASFNTMDLPSRVAGPPVFHLPGQPRDVLPGICFPNVFRGSRVAAALTKSRAAVTEARSTAIKKAPPVY
jgi:hypothetical protein